jgi:hypothetical protein
VNDTAKRSAPGRSWRPNRPPRCCPSPRTGAEHDQPY